MDVKIQLSQIITVVVLWILSVGCTENILDRTADKDTTEAILFDANQALNQRDYTKAIDIFETLDTATLNSRAVLSQYASAYAGRCGLEFINLVDNLSDVSASSMFGVLMGAFPGATLTNAADCDQAETLLKTIGDESVRDINENLLIAFNSFAEIGTILSALADIDDDQTVDAAFDQCDTNDISDAEVDAIGAAMALLIKSFAGIGGQYADIDTISTTCQDPLYSDICDKDNGGFNATELTALRGLIGSSDLGVGSCGPLGDISCFCP